MPVEILCCYAHQDEPLLNKLKTHLTPLQREGLIDVWHDRNITAGTEWEKEISKHLNTAHIILLLISPDFIASDYCFSVEMKRALERHEREEARVIPIILEHVYWQIAPLKKLQALPTDARPIVSKSWHNPNEAFLDVVKGIRKAAEELLASKKVQQRHSNVLNERYELRDKLGKGSTSIIYRGHDRLKNQLVAIKVLHDFFPSDEETIKGFERQIMALWVLNHPNIIRVYDYSQRDGIYFIVMELVEGTDLRRYRHSRGIVDAERASIIAYDAALGLGEAHRSGIIHRDVQPAHVLIDKNDSIKLTGFSTVRVYKNLYDEHPTPPGMTLGTIQYFAPEQAQGDISTPASDVYALGVVMYEMLTGQVPFDGSTPIEVAMQHILTPPIPPRKLNPEIPSFIEEIVLRCLEKEPAKRYPDGLALAKVLQELHWKDFQSR